MAINNVFGKIKQSGDELDHTILRLCLVSFNTYSSILCHLVSTALSFLRKVTKSASNAIGSPPNDGSGDTSRSNGGGCGDGVLNAANLRKSNLILEGDMLPLTFGCAGRIPLPCLELAFSVVLALVLVLVFALGLALVFVGAVAVPVVSSVRDAPIDCWET